MDASYSMNAQVPFFYYNPDPAGENTRQHGHFTPHPHGLPTPSYATQPMYSQPMYTHSMATPVASPQPVYQKPTILIQGQNATDLHPLQTDFDAPYCATPPLSSSGSSVGTPPSTHDYLHTPVETGTFFEKLEAANGIKQGCEGSVYAEILSAGPEFRSMTPPLTPSKCFQVVLWLSVIGPCVHDFSHFICASNLQLLPWMVLTDINQCFSTRPRRGHTFCPRLPAPLCRRHRHRSRKPPLAPLRPCPSTASPRPPATPATSQLPLLQSCRAFLSSAQAKRIFGQG
jgi:hypothetical protein